MGLRQLAVFAAFSFLSVSAGICAETKLTLWTINAKTPFGNLTDKTALEFSQNTPGFDLDSIHFTNNYYKTKLRAAMGTQDVPDIFHNWGVSSLQSYVRDGKVLALDPIRDKLEKNFLPISFNPVTFGGKTYGVPYGGMAGVFFWYRKDVFKKYDLKPPKTWKDLIDTGEVLKQNGIIPITLANKHKWPGSFYYMYLVDRIGGPMLFHDAFTGKNNRTFTDPAFIKAGEMIQDLVKRDFFPKGFNRLGDMPADWNSLIVAGQAGMYLMGSWFLSMLSDLPPELREKFDFFVFPLVEDGLGTSENLVGSPGQDYLSISAACKHPDIAMRFLSGHINSEKYFRELAAQGFVPPVKNARAWLSDPIAVKVADMFNSAGHVQIYYDQLMPPAMAEIHKLSIHRLFDLQLTPEQVARNHEEAMRSEPSPK